MTTTDGEPRAYHIDAVERSLRVLEVLAERSEASLAELVSDLDAPKGSVFRHLKVLEQGGYVRQTPMTKRYALGPRLIYLGFASRRHLELPEVAGPAMVRVRNEFNETVHLGVISNAEVVHVATALSTHPLKMATEVGDRTGAHVSALGKAILAFVPRWRVEDLVASRGLPGHTQHTITTAEGLDLELVMIRDRGYAIDDEESSLGLRCVAAPIRDESGTAIGAMSVSSPTERLSRQQSDAVGRRLIVVADEISTRFGWRPPRRSVPVRRPGTTHGA